MRRMFTISRRLILGWLILGCLTSRATESEPQPRIEDLIKSWIANLDSPSFSARNAASLHLRDAGTAAFPALVEAARQGSPETVTRALALLNTYLHSGDDAVQTEARKSLEQIAALSKTSAGRSAQQVLLDFDRPPQQYAREFGGRGGFQNPMGNNVAQRINTWTRNGTTTIEAFERDRKLKIQMTQQGRITVERTQKNQGIDITNKFEAESIAELRRKHPSAFWDYQRYETTMSAARSIAQRNQPPNQMRPLPVEVLPARNFPRLVLPRRPE